VRELEKIIGIADQHGLDHAELAEMPANNLSVVFRKREIGPYASAPVRATNDDATPYPRAERDAG
jgi:hypothetical protein